MPAHIHAALMAEYAKDAAETDKPWERWEWRMSADRPWCPCRESPNWHAAHDYLRKRIPLCRVEGKDVFPGDKLWSLLENACIIAHSMKGKYLRADSTQLYTVELLSWTEPPKTKTVYQWAMRQGDRWFCSSTMVADKVEMVANFPNFTDFRRLDWTALEVPV